MDRWTNHGQHIVDVCRNLSYYFQLTYKKWFRRLFSKDKKYKRIWRHWKCSYRMVTKLANVYFIACNVFWHLPGLAESSRSKSDVHTVLRYVCLTLFDLGAGHVQPKMANLGPLNTPSPGPWSSWKDKFPRTRKPRPLEYWPRIGGPWAGAGVI